MVGIGSGQRLPFGIVLSVLWDVLLEQTKTQFLHVFQTGCVLDVSGGVVVGHARLLDSVICVTDDALAMILQGSDQPFAIACHSGVGRQKLMTNDQTMMGRLVQTHQR